MLRPPVRAPEAGTTIVLVTHALGLIADLCDQAAWLDHGVVREIGPAREVVDSYLRSVNEHEAHARDETEAQAAIAAMPEGSTGSGPARSGSDGWRRSTQTRTRCRS